MKNFLLIFLLFFSSGVFSQCFETLDQQLSSFNQGTQGNDQWQTFTAGMTGRLTRVDIYFNGIQSLDLTIEIRNGYGSGAPLMYTNTYTFTSVNNWQTMSIPFGSAPTLINGNQYTLRLLPSTNAYFLVHTGNLLPGEDYYSDIYGGVQAGWDLNFRTYITPEPAPTINITGSTNPTCNGGNDGTISTQTISGTGPYTYSWTPSGQTVANPTSLSSGTHTVTVTDANGCIATNNATLTDPPAITANAGADQSVCEESPTVSLSGSVTVASGGTWTSSGTGTFANPNNLNTTYSPSALDISTGSVTITLTTTGNGTCSAVQDNMTVTIHPSPIVNAGADQTVCEGTSTVLSGSGNAISYSWDNGITDGTPFTQPPGTVTYTVTGTSSFGCTSTDQADITVVANPIVNVTCSDADQVICQGESVTFTATAGYSSYEFFVNASSVQSGTSNVYTTTGLANGDVVTTQATAAGCTSASPDNFTFTVNTPPVVFFSNPFPTLCDNDPPYNMTEGMPAGGTYVGLGVSANTFDPTNNPGSHTINYSYTDGNGCSNNASQNFTVNSAPSIVASSGTGAICVGQSTTISATGGVSYNWDNGLGAGATHNVSPATSTTYTVTGTASNGCQNTDNTTITVNPLPNVTFSALPPLCLDPAPYTFTEGGPSGGTYSGPGVSGGSIDPINAGTGTHTIYYMFTDGNGCSNLDSSDIVIYDSPTVVANATATSLCDGDALTLTGSGASTYSWNNGVTDGVSFIPAVGSYNYVVNGSDGNGCFGTDSIAVTVYTLPTVSAGTNQEICEGNAVTLNGSGAVTYVWDNGVTDGVPFNPAVGTITYTLTGTDANNCQNTDQVDVIVHPNPVLVVSPDQTFCLGDSVTLTASGANSYDWDGGQSNLPTYVLNPTNNVNISLTGSSTFGCVANHQVNLTLDDPAQVDAGADLIICEGFTANLSASGGVNYYWNGPGIMNENNQDISFTVDTSAYYYATITTNFGCDYTDSLLVSISTDPNCTIETVSGFSPNDDGVNDYWVIQGIEGFSDNTVTIYNRWGDIVFQESGYDNDLIKWDGLYNGQKLGAGTYFYLIEIADGPTQSGWVQLMK